MKGRLTNSGIATARTTWNGTISAVALYLIARLTGWSLEADDPLVIAAIGGGITIVHRISTVLVEIWPPLGFILFGIPRTPNYPPLPPPSTPSTTPSATVYPTTSPSPEARP